MLRIQVFGVVLVIFQCCKSSNSVRAVLKSVGGVWVLLSSIKRTVLSKYKDCMGLNHGQT